jgi:hypothetical protein
VRYLGAREAIEWSGAEMFYGQTVRHARVEAFGEALQSLMLLKIAQMLLNTRSKPTQSLSLQNLDEVLR